MFNSQWVGTLCAIHSLTLPAKTVRAAHAAHYSRSTGGRCWKRMSSIQRWTSAHIVVRWQWSLGSREGDRLVVWLMNGRQTRGRVSYLTLFLLAALSSSHDLTGAALVCRVIEEGANVVDEQWIQHFRDLFLVGEIQCSLIWNPRREMEEEEEMS